MRATLLAPALVALGLLAPLATAAPSPDYPPELLAAANAWLAEADAAGASHRDAPWWPEAGRFLDEAHAAHAAGRLRVVMFDLETYHEVLLAKRLLDETATMGTDAERKAHIVATSNGWRDDAERAWTAYRAKLHGYDGQLRSLQTVEQAMYSADIALSSIAMATDHDAWVREMQRTQGVPEGIVLGLVRVSHSPLLNVGYADDLLDAATRNEGQPPRIKDDAWRNLTEVAAASSFDNAPSYLRGVVEKLDPARANGEGLLSVAGTLVEERLIRISSMGTIFGDGGSRGQDVIRDSSRGMNKQLNNTTMATPRAVGLSGIFTADAIDRANYVNEFVANQSADLGTVLSAWGALEHQGYVVRSLSTASPVEPPAPTPDTKETPAPGLLALAAVALGIAAARRRA